MASILPAFVPRFPRLQAYEVMNEDAGLSRSRPAARVYLPGELGALNDCCDSWRLSDWGA
jgi:hypothetical protein